MELIVKGAEVKVLMGDLEIGDVILCAGEFLMKVGVDKVSGTVLFVNLTDIEEKGNRTNFDMLLIDKEYVGSVFKAELTLEVKL